MTSPLIERMARAIDPRAFGPDEILHSLGSFDARPQRQAAALTTARAALAAAREPTEAMYRAYADQCSVGGDLMPAPDDFRPDLMPLPRDLMYVFGKMIDAALAEEG